MVGHYASTKGWGNMVRGVTGHSLGTTSFPGDLPSSAFCSIEVHKVRLRRIWLLVWINLSVFIILLMISKWKPDIISLVFHQSIVILTYLFFVVFFFTSLMLLSIGKNVVSWSLHFKQFSKYLLIVSHTRIKSAAVTKMKGSHSCSEIIHSLVEETNNYYSRQTIIFKMVKSSD